MSRLRNAAEMACTVVAFVALAALVALSRTVCTMEFDGAYRRRLATWLGTLASRMMEP